MLFRSTSNINVKFRKAVEADKGILTIRAKLVDHNRKLATIYTELLNSKGELCTEAEITYFIFSKDVARSKFNYPGKEAFFK